MPSTQRQLVDEVQGDAHLPGSGVLGPPVLLIRGPYVVDVVLQLACLLVLGQIALRLECAVGRQPHVLEAALGNRILWHPTIRFENTPRVSAKRMLQQNLKVHRAWSGRHEMEMGAISQMGSLSYCRVFADVTLTR